MRAASVALALLLLPGAGRAAVPVSGLYAGILIHVRGDQVFGAFSEMRQGNGTAEAPQFSCAFLFRGRIVDDTAPIIVWTPPGAATGGVLRFTSTGAALRLEEEQPGCGMTSGPMVREDYTAPFDGAGRDWIGVRLVQGRRVVLHGRPWLDGWREPHVSSYDAVAVVGMRAGWLRVRSTNRARPVTGWVRAAELFSDEPPRR